MQNPAQLRFFRASLPVVLLSALCAAPASAAGKGAARGVTILQPWARATVPGAAVGAAYLTIVSNGATDELLSAHSTVAAHVEMHSMTMQGGEMQMRPRSSQAVPAGGKVVFAPGGLHLMLVDLKAPLREGSHFTLKLRFRVAGSVAVDVPVQGLGTMEAPASNAVPRGGAH